MTDNQENKLTAAEAVSLLLDKNTAIWTPLPAFSDIATKVKSVITDIQDLRQIQALNTKGITVNKTDIGEQLLAATLKLIRAMAAYASLNNLHSLLAEINYTPSELLSSRDNIFYDKALIVQNKAASLETELSEFMIKPDDITGQHTLLTQYLAAIPEKRTAQTVSKTSTHDLKLKFKELDTLLKEKLDRLVLLFETENPDFVQQYFNARIIIDLGHRSTTNKTSLTGLVTQFDNDQPIEGVHVWVVETGQSFTTGSDGHYLFNFEEGGTFVIKAEKSGYHTFTSDKIQINKGQQSTLEIDLGPIQ